MNNLRYFVCQDDCFRVEGIDEREIMEMAKLHIKNMHKMDLKDSEIKKMIKIC